MRRGRGVRDTGPTSSRASSCSSPARAQCAASHALVLILLLVVSSAAFSAERIVTLAPHLTELTFAAGAGERIVATVDFSDQPAAARNIPRIGDAFRVDLERLLAVAPDAVLVWESGTPGVLIERLESLKLPVVRLATRELADIPQVVRRIGELADTQEIATAAAARFERDLAALRQKYRNRPVVSVFLQVNERPLYTVNQKHIMNEVIELCGGRNIFADLNELAPAVSVEAVIAANPQVILAAVNDADEALSQWQRWQHIEAVRTRNVYALRSDDISRATTRLISGAREVCRTLDTARRRSG